MFVARSKIDHALPELLRRAVEPERPQLLLHLPQFRVVVNVVLQRVGKQGNDLLQIRAVLRIVPVRLLSFGRASVLVRERMRVLVGMHRLRAEPLVLMRVLARMCMQVRMRGFVRVLLRVERAAALIDTVVHKHNPPRLL